MWYGSQTTLHSSKRQCLEELEASCLGDETPAGFKSQLPLPAASPQALPKPQECSFLLCKMSFIRVFAAQPKGLEIRNVSVAGPHYVFNNWPLLLLIQGHTLKW